MNSGKFLPDKKTRKGCLEKRIWFTHFNDRQGKERMKVVHEQEVQNLPKNELKEI